MSLVQDYVNNSDPEKWTQEEREKIAEVAGHVWQLLQEFRGLSAVSMALTTTSRNLYVGAEGVTRDDVNKLYTMALQKASHVVSLMHAFLGIQDQENVERNAFMTLVLADVMWTLLNADIVTTGAEIMASLEAANAPKN